MNVLAIFRPRRRDLASQMAQAGGDLTAMGKGNPFQQFQVRSLVDAGMHIEGNVVSYKGAAIDGRVVGDVTVRAANSALLVRESARIEGTVSAPIVLIRGEVHGDIEGRFVRLFPGCRVHGRITAGRLVMDDGASLSNDAIGIGPVIEHDRPVASQVSQPAIAQFPPPEQMTNRAEAMVLEFATRQGR